MFSTRAQTVALFGVSRDLREGFTRVGVRGDLDLFTAPLREGEPASLERGRDPIVVDLSDLSFMDVSGLCPLAGARNRAGARGRQFTIVGCRPAVRKVFELTGLTGMLGEAVPELWEANTRG